MIWRNMCTLANVVSLIRMPLALVFLVQNPVLRCGAVGVAILTDLLDGHLARRYGQTSQLGAVVDPLMDRFFVVFALAVLISEDTINYYELAALLCRDAAIVLFGLYLIGRGSFSQVCYHALWCGKVTTSCQFVVLMAVCLGYDVPAAVFSLFVALGLFTLVELCVTTPEIVENIGMGD